MCKKNIWRAIVSLSFSVCLVSANAAIIDTSKNSAVLPGAAAYIGDVSGSPTPHMAGGPTPQSIFSPTDPIRIAQSISLADVNEANDDNKIDFYEGTTDLIWDYWGADGIAISGLVWSVDWYDPTDTWVDSNLMFVSWSDIDAWKADSALTQISFWTDLWVPTTYGPLMSGMWNADIYFDGNYSDTVSFAVVSAPVPVPVTLLLFATGFVMLRRWVK